MKILLISHNVLSQNNNMGKTLLGYFSSFKKGNVIQFYIHSEIPTNKQVCVDYFRFSDIDAIKSVLNKKNKGAIFKEQDIKDLKSKSLSNNELETSIRNIGRNRTPFIYVLRNILWKLSAWNNQLLKKWLNEKKPDVIFFAAGDYKFMYRIVLKLKKMLNIPLILVCMDDYYLHNRNESKFFGKLVYNSFMKTVNKTMEEASLVFCICESMTKSYSNLFNKKCITLHTPAPVFSVVPTIEKGERISYIGNLGYERYKQLIDVGEALTKIDNNLRIDVYSKETRKDVLHLLNKSKGINYCGPVSYEEIPNIMENSKLIIHTESFDSNIKENIKYSVSTKIAESLMYGPCLIAYGPNDIASIDYLRKYKAAFVITKKEELTKGLINILNDKSLRDSIIKNARILAKNNHELYINSEKIKNILENIVLLNCK